MGRGVVVVVLVVALTAAAALGYRWMATEQGPGEEAEERTACYPLQQVCRWQTSAGEASVAMSALEGDELQMNVALPGGSDRVIVILTGESMYMGEYPLRMQDTDEQGDFRVRFVPPFCSTGDDMVWRVNLQVGKETMAVPLRLLFRHPQS